MAEINTYRVEDGDSIELPSNLTDEGVAVHREDEDDWIVVIEDPSATTQTYVRHRGVVTAAPTVPAANNVVVIQLNEDVFDYLSPQ